MPRTAKLQRLLRVLNADSQYLSALALHDHVTYLLSAKEEAVVDGRRVLHARGAAGRFRDMFIARRGLGGGVIDGGLADGEGFSDCSWGPVCVLPLRGGWQPDGRSGGGGAEFMREQDTGRLSFRFRWSF